MPTPTIYDAYGRPARVDTEEIPRPDTWGDWHVPPSTVTRGLTPQRITAIFDEADHGYPQRQAELFADQVLKDGKLAGMWRTRTLAPAKWAWELEQASEDAADKRVLEWLRPKLESLGLRVVLKRLMNGVGYGYAAEQILWAVAGGDVDVVGIKHWPTRYLLPDAEGRIHYLTSVEDPSGWEMPAAKFIVHCPGELGPDPIAAGLFRTATWYWYFKNFVLKAWLQFLDIYGQPFRWGTFPAGAKQDDKEYAYRSLLRMGQEAVALLPEGFQVNIQDIAHRGGADLYERLKMACDEEIAILFLGQTLTSSVGENGGAYAAAKVHEDVRWDLIDWDAEALGETITRDLLTPWVRFRWGADAEVPQLRIHEDPPEDLEATSKVHKTLVVDMGLPVSRRYLYERYGIQEPAADEEVLAGPPPAAEPAAPAAASQRDPGVIAARQTGEETTAGKPRWPAGATPSADSLSWMI